MIINLLIVFSLVLILTKSKITAGKREYVEQRYISAKVGDNKPSIIHRWWHALWSCSMCSGFWFSLLIAVLRPINSIFADTLVMFGLNWLLHCLESILFFASKWLETKSNEKH